MPELLTPAEQVEAKLAEPSSGGEERPRDEHGKFVAAEETPPGEPEAPPAEDPPTTEEPAGDAPTEKGEEGKEAPVVPPSLTLEVDDPPVFDHDGKFVGGKFLGKYETIDDELVAHKNAVRELGRLQTENKQLREAPPPTTAEPVDAGFITDPFDLTDDQLVELVVAQIGDKELTFDERIEAQENPAVFAAKNAVKVQRMLDKLKAYHQSWVDATKTAYPVYDKARAEGDRVWKDFKSGKVRSPEFRVILGLGEMARANLLSGDKEVTRVKPPGRSPVTAATASVRTPPKADDRAEQKRLLKEMSDASLAG